MNTSTLHILLLSHFHVGNKHLNFYIGTAVMYIRRNFDARRAVAIQIKMRCDDAGSLDSESFLA